MAEIKSDELENKLLHKGFALDRTTDHKYYVLMYNNKKTRIRTKISLGSPYVLGKPLIDATKNQLHITSKELFDYVACTFSKEDLYKRLISDGTIPLCS